MARVKSIAARRHRKIRASTKGFKQARNRRVKAGREAAMHAGQYAYEGRKNKKRDLRSLWILRIGAAVKKSGLSYSKFIAGLNKNKIGLNRKVLSELAVNNPEIFNKIVEESKK